MSVNDVIQLGSQALWVGMLLAAPLLLTALGIGLLVGILQAATQIQEMTLSFIPKLIGVGVVLVVGGHWMLALMIEWFRGLLLGIPGMLS